MPRRKRDEWGSIKTVRRDVHYIRFWADLHDGRGYRRCSETVHGPKRLAQERRRELRELHSDDTPHFTMGQAHEILWLPEAQERLAEGSLAKATLSLYGSMWRNHIAPAWAAQPIDDIDPVEVQAWLLGLSRWNAVHSLSLASSVAETAIMFRRASTNPFRPSKRPYRMPSGSDGHTKAVWDLQTIGRAAQALKGTPLELPLILVGLGSCRVGEAMAVMADEVEVTREHGMLVARVPVRRQLLKTGEVTETLKTPQSARVVCVPEPWSLRVAEVAKARRNEGLEWLADNGRGAPLERGTLYKRWRQAFGAGGPLEGFEKVPLTNLRNSWQTFMRWELGVDADLVDSMMGHKGKDTRTRYYDRPLPDVYAETCALAHLGAYKKSPNPPRRED